MARQEENAEIVYRFLREHQDAALHWIDNNNYHQPQSIWPDIEPGDPAYGFWEIYSPTGYTTHEDGYPIQGDDMTQLAYALMEREIRA